MDTNGRVDGVDAGLRFSRALAMVPPRGRPIAAGVLFSLVGSEPSWACWEDLMRVALRVVQSGTDGKRTDALAAARDLAQLADEAECEPRAEDRSRHALQAVRAFALLAMEANASRQVPVAAGLAHAPVLLVSAARAAGRSPASVLQQWIERMART